MIEMRSDRGGQDLPLVTVAIPTYNRCDRLDLSLGSATAQSYPSLEIVVSNNASTDETAAVLQRWAERDPRVRVINRPINIGPTGNFNSLLEAAKGRYFMWLADDDRLSSDYVSACIEAIRSNPSAVGAFGAVVYHRRRDQFEFGTHVFSVLGATPAERVRSYYEQVIDNAMFYGVFRRDALVAESLDGGLAGDWLTMAGLAVHGEILCVEGPKLHRGMGGASGSKDKATMVRALGLPRWQGWMPWTVTAIRAARHIFRNAPGTFQRRLVLAWQVFSILSARFRVRLLPRVYRRRLRARLEARHPRRPAQIVLEGGGHSAGAMESP